uniref:Uncharacterized protein n=1 Tax=Streptomyces sp. NBC_00093 TaxID=2975649 RepID=A0AAU2A022_9ACTN
MPVYPSIPAGRRITDALLESMLPIVVVKSAGESVTSSTTLQNDNELLAPVEANATYDVFLLLLHDSDATAAADIKVGWTGPASAALNWGVHGANSAATSSTSALTNMQTRTIAEVAAFGGGDSSGTTALIYGTLTTAGTAGTLQLQWAQETSNGVATNVRAGSRLEVRRTA